MIVHVRTHWKALMAPFAVLVLTVGVAAFLIVLTPGGDLQQWLRLGVATAAALVVLGAVLWPVLSWLTSTYTVTNHRIITRQGVITRTGRDIPLSRINDVSHERDLLDRVLRCGTLVIWSAGEQGKVILKDVPRVQQIRAQIADLLYRSGEDEPTTT